MFKVNNKDNITCPFKPYSSVSIVNFEHVIAGWVNSNFLKEAIFAISC